MAMVRHPICVALEKVQMLSKKKDQENSFHKSYDNPAEKVDSADIILHTLFQYFTKESFLLIPRVCKRWSSFRTENMWKNRSIKSRISSRITRIKFSSHGAIIIYYFLITENFIKTTFI